MAITSTKGKVKLSASYPKLVVDISGNVYFAFSRTTGVAVSVNNGRIGNTNFYNNTVDWEASNTYFDYDGSVILTNSPN